MIAECSPNSVDFLAVNLITDHHTYDTACVQITKVNLFVKTYLRTCNLKLWYRFITFITCKQTHTNRRFHIREFLQWYSWCVWKRVNFLNSHLYCSWKLQVRQSPCHDKNECHYRSCLHKTEVLFSQSNISPAEIAGFF